MGVEIDRQVDVVLKRFYEHIAMCNMPTGATNDKEDKADDDEDNEVMVTNVAAEEKKTETSAPCWPSKVFAVECVEKIMNVCHSHNSNHIDFDQARQLKSSGQG